MRPRTRRTAAISEPAPTALVLHPDCALHDTGWRHPEHQGRLPAIVGAVHRAMPELLEHVLQAEGVPATVEDLRRCHAPAQIDRVVHAVDQARAQGMPAILAADTMVSAASWDAALAAAGCAMTATRLVLEGEARTAFALTRPPGHHATATQAMGFCLFNNVALATRCAQAHGIERVLVVDWDVHHGNGTQDIFWEDPSVFYLSLHLAAHYPGTGSVEERGAGAGVGATLNVPLRAGTGPVAYQGALERALDEALASFTPDLVMVSAGFDVLAGDPLGGLTLEPHDLHRLTRTLMNAASAAEGRVVVALEGGYVPERTARGAVEVLRALAGLPSADGAPAAAPAD